MDREDSSNDESSIAPVSSLRHRFEQLGSAPGSREISAIREQPGVTKQSNARSNVSIPPNRHAYVDRNQSPSRVQPSTQIPVKPFSNALSTSTAPTADIMSKTIKKPLVPRKKPGLYTQPSDALQTAFTESITVKGQDSVAESVAAQEHDSALEAGSGLEKAHIRGRFSSDASWVEQLHERQNSQSDVDLMQSSVDVLSQRARGSSMQDALRTRPARVSSDASWVEALTTTPPPPPRTMEKIREDRQPTVWHGETFTSRTSTPSSRASPSPHRASPSPRLDLSTRDGRSRQASRSPRRVEKPVSGVVQDDSSRSTAVFRAPRSLQRSAADLDAPKSLQRSGTYAVDGAEEIIRKKGLQPPAVPAPRRSLDRRRDFSDPPSRMSDPPSRMSVSCRQEIPQVLQQAFPTNNEPADAIDDSQMPTTLANFPDSSAANRRPPRFPKAPWHIPTEYDTRLVVADYGLVCTSGFITKVWDVRNGSRILEMPHQEAKKVTALALTADRGNAQLWLGTCAGDVLQIDIASCNIVNASHQAHRGREIVRIFTKQDIIWTVDDGGETNVWATATLGKPLNTHRLPRGHTFSLDADDKLWVASGKDVQVYRPRATNDKEFLVSKQPLTQANLGDISAGTVISERVYFGHTDGKISVYDRQRLTCIGIVHVSLSKICVLSGIGNYLWAGFGAGNLTVYDTTSSVWAVRKDWTAHDKQVCGIVADKSSFRESGIIRVISLALDNNIRIWDGLYTSDWLEDRLNSHLSRFSTFDELSISVLTWNAGASKPSNLQHMISDEDQLVEYLRRSSTSDIMVFGFQELVDLEDKKLTAKSIFKSKKKDAYEQEHMTHQYRAWRDYLSRLLIQRKGDQYVLLHTASMIGLFTCIFVRASLRHRIKHVHQAEVKRGMGGHYGNKGALILRMVVDDSSVCFLNCHLAAGQTQTSSRNNDIAAILDSMCLPAPKLDHHAPSDVFSGGGDGSMILDHDICILNGDLNYRIDTMSRETVIKHVQQGNIARLLERDQLRLSRKKNPVFKLRVFEENEIRFAPTYKYNVGTDIYDTSEKKRSPAWCDRVLYRGDGIISEDYRRWEVKISDHRPVSTMLKCRIKKVDVSKRADVMKECLQAFDAYRQALSARH